MKIFFLTIVLSVLAFAERPNIVLIMADDMGYSDIGCYGGEIATPNIDRLSEEGMRFLNFYNNSKCGVTRASLLTGKYAHGMNFKKQATFADVLESAGYRTIMSGKWHQPDTPIDYGFERFTGLLDGCCNYWNPGIEAIPGEPLPGRKPSMVKKNAARFWGIENKKIEGYTPESKDFYTTDVFSDYAVERLEEYKDEEKPFLLYLAYTAPHYPLHAWPEDIAKYEETYKVGWDVIRKNRFAAVKEKGLIPEGVKLTPRDPEVPSWDSLSPKQKEEEAYKMAVYAAMVDRMDQGIGKVLDKLEELGKRDNTLVLFLSDNGACAELPSSDDSIPPGPVESYRSLGKGWANATNAPYKQYKVTMYEGGIKTPLIASWPNAIKAKSITQESGHIMDFLPTFMELAGGEYPTEIRGEKQDPVYGRSIVPILKGGAVDPYDSLCFTFSDALGMIEGDWKILRKKSSDKSKTSTPWELYNLKDDPTELKNLAAEQPERLEKMAQKLTNWDVESKQKR